MGQGTGPLCTAGGSPGWVRHWEQSDLCRGQRPAAAAAAATAPGRASLPFRRNGKLATPFTKWGLCYAEKERKLEHGTPKGGSEHYDPPLGVPCSDPRPLKKIALRRGRKPLCHKAFRAFWYEKARPAIDKAGGFSLYWLQWFGLPPLPRIHEGTSHIFTTGLL